MADTVRQMPSRAVRADIEFPLKLKRGDAFLCRAEQRERHQPFAQGKMRVLEDSPDRDRELLVAVIALENARAVRMPLEPGYVLSSAAMRANRAIRPEDAFNRLAGFILGKSGDFVEGQHGTCPSIFYL